MLKNDQKFEFMTFSSHEIARPLRPLRARNVTEHVQVDGDRAR